MDRTKSNTEGIGSRIYVTIGKETQMRELRAGSNYVSQDPAEAFFGLGKSRVIDEVEIVWLYGGSTVMKNVAANQQLVIIRKP